MTNDVDELLIQRCVDNEITAVERELLLQQLETAPDGWKELACTYMEEQLFAAAVVDPDQKIATRLSGNTAPAPAPGRRWLQHPLTSVALSACVAFMLGLLISGRSPELPVPELAEAPRDSAADTSPNNVIASSGPLTDSPPAYRVQLESDGDTLRDVPVFDDPSRYVTEYEAVQQRFLHSLGGDVPRGDASPQIRFIRLPLQDGRVIVVPVESFRLGPQFQ